MKHFTRFMLFTFVAITVFAPIIFVQTTDAHYNYLLVTYVTEYCLAIPASGPVFCNTLHYYEFKFIYSLNDHVKGLDENDNEQFLHIPNHQNHIQAIYTGLTRTQYVYVDSCSECEQ